MIKKRLLNTPRSLKVTNHMDRANYNMSFSVLFTRSATGL